MVFEGIVRNGTVVIPPGTDLPDGILVRVETSPRRQFNDLAGTWKGDDADSVVAEIDARRSSAPLRT